MMRLPRLPRARRAAALGAACGFALATLGGCFSERGATDPVARGECRVPLDETTAGATIVFIKDFAFHPQNVSVPSGGRVVWVNCDDPGSDSHTSTSDGPEWDSGLLAPGMVYSRQFGAAESLPYHCEPHPSMTGTVTVQ